MAKYRATADCFFDGQYYPQGAIFEGRELTGYDKETATYLEVIGDEDTSAPAKKGAKKSAADDEL